jgi:hypothetical protein
VAVPVFTGAPEQLTLVPEDGVSRRITLKEGRNVIRAAIFNAGGATDFCARFLDYGYRPITGLTVRLD